MQSMAINFPKLLIGVTSPYPTAVIVTTDHQSVCIITSIIVTPPGGFPILSEKLSYSKIIISATLIRIKPNI